MSRYTIRESRKYVTSVIWESRRHKSSLLKSWLKPHCHQISSSLLQIYIRHAPTRFPNGGDGVPPPYPPPRHENLQATTASAPSASIAAQTPSKTHPGLSPRRNPSRPLRLDGFSFWHCSHAPHGPPHGAGGEVHRGSACFVRCWSIGQEASDRDGTTTRFRS